MALLRAAYAQIASTFSGSMLTNALEKSPFLYQITNVEDPDWPGYVADANPYTGVIHVDPSFHPTLAVDGPCPGNYETASTLIVLEHELGHAATGTEDTGPDRMDNVNRSASLYCIHARASHLIT